MGISIVTIMLFYAFEAAATSLPGDRWALVFL